MSMKFNINRPPVSDDEIKQHQNFDNLLKQFKNESIAKAREDRSWWKNKKITYSATIAGLAVICTVTIYSILNNSKPKKITTNEVKSTKKEIKSESKTIAFINAPNKTLKPALKKYKINADKGGDIIHNKSKITIPKNAFIDEKGIAIKGEVEIEYREFHDAADIILSGIPMLYDSANIKRNFESAGMFEINGVQNGVPLKVHPDKSLKISLASYNNETKFNQYYLDTIDRKWKYIGKDFISPITKPDKSITISVSNESNLKIETLQNTINVVIPKKIDSVEKLCNVKRKALPAVYEPSKPNKATGRPNFVLDGNYDEFPELKSFKNLLFEVGEENKNYNKTFHEITWNEINVSEGPAKGKNYILTLKYRNKQEKLIVYPVLEGQDLIAAEKIYSSKLKDYQTQLEKRNEKESKLINEFKAKQTEYFAQKAKAEAELKAEKEKLAIRIKQQQEANLSENYGGMSSTQKVNRIFQIKNFGIYNSDCPHTILENNLIKPIFTLNGKPVFSQYVYLINYTTNNVVILNKNEGFNVNIENDKSYAFCLFNNDKLFFCDKNSVIEGLNNNNKFSVIDKSESLKSIVDIRKLLES